MPSSSSSITCRTSSGLHTLPPSSVAPYRTHCHTCSEWVGGRVGFVCGQQRGAGEHKPARQHSPLNPQTSLHWMHASLQTATQATSKVSPPGQNRRC